MLKLIQSLKELNFYQLMNVYEESNRENGSEKYPGFPENQQVMQAEQDFYEYLRTFLKCARAFYAVWEIDGKYVSALRMEPYENGMLLEALETAPALRRKGYASSLMKETIRFLERQGPLTVYSHVNKRNIASLATHYACGFERVMEHAVYIDGSVMHNSCTLKYCSRSI